MKKKKILEKLEDNPIILAVKGRKELDRALEEESSVIFLLGQSLTNLKEDVKKVKDSGKIAIVHIDLIEGISSREESVDFIKDYTNVDGIISTKPIVVKRAKEVGLFAILRQFIIDSLSLKNLDKNILKSDPDMIEILPGVMPKIIKKISMKSKVPIISGGLILDKEDVLNALKNGAMAISTSNEDVWKL